ncbi:MAG: hypothetical protein KUG73_07480 [Pseudomonadales bacterium]|nr:hypothetical protein [Pseudomonadales bacterium]
MQNWRSKESLKLLLSGFFAFFAVFLFWGYSGERAPQIIVTVVLAGFFLENRALRKTIAGYNGKDSCVAEDSGSSLIEKS